MATHIRRLGRGDERLLRTTRLEALRDAPAAFGTSLEAARSRPDDFWQRQVDGRLGDQPCATWIALDDVGDGVGMLTGVELEGAVEVIQVWVAPDHRGTGLIERLFDALFEWAPHPRVVIAVARSNLRAKRVYERLGFSVEDERPGSREPEIELSQRRDVKGS